jgi:hypothetical protein
MTLSDGFVWARQEWGLVLRSDPLAEVADHFFTTSQLRLRGESDAEDWGRVAAAIGVAPPRLLRLTQVHGCAVVVCRGRGAGPAVPPSAPGHTTSSGTGWPEADILVTDDSTVALAIQVADCVPLLLADTQSAAVAAVHAGWRGTAAGAAPAAVAALGWEFGSEPEDLVVALGPSIGPCCYVVGEALIDTFRRGGFAADIDRWFARGEAGDLRLDLWAANRDQLRTCGVPSGAIHQAGLCTASHPDLFASYRRDGPGTGRIAAVIRSRGRGSSGRV